MEVDPSIDLNNLPQCYTSCGASKVTRENASNNENLENILELKPISLRDTVKDTLLRDLKPRSWL